MPSGIPTVHGEVQFISLFMRVLKLRCITIPVKEVDQFRFHESSISCMM